LFCGNQCLSFEITRYFYFQIKPEESLALNKLFVCFFFFVIVEDDNYDDDDDDMVLWCCGGSVGGGGGGGGDGDDDDDDDGGGGYSGARTATAGFLEICNLMLQGRSPSS
jgi:hypothetical protein